MYGYKLNVISISSHGIKAIGILTYKMDFTFSKASICFHLLREKHILHKDSFFSMPAYFLLTA